jgi:adenylate cyclase
VLPFANMSGDPEQEYFSDGISEDITTDLSKISALSVVARNAAFTFKGRAADVCEVARKLGVSHVLEGSVRKAGGRVRINAQLIDGRTGDHVWAERYDRELTDIFAIQDEISNAIVSALKLKLLPEEKQAIEQHGTTSVEAYNLYLMARQSWVNGNHGDVRREERAARIARRVVEIDPGYAEAWALLALAEANLRFGFDREGDGGLGSAERALALDPRIAEAHAVKSRILFNEGQAEAAEAELARALALDPDSWEVNKEAARQRRLQGRVAEATIFYEKAVAAMESDFHAWGMLLTGYRAAGDEARLRHAAAKTVEQARRALAQDPSNGSALGLVANGLALLGEHERAQEWIERALLIDPDNLNTRYNFACVLANELGDSAAALDLLIPALGACGRLMIQHALTDPDLDSLRGDPAARPSPRRPDRACPAASPPAPAGDGRRSPISR